MQAYEKSCSRWQVRVLNMNPFPRKLKDGLITECHKSAELPKKRGTSPIKDRSGMLMAETLPKPALTLLCTPGNM